MGDNEQANAEVIAEATAGPAGADQAVAAAELRAVRNLELKAVLLLVVFVLMLGAAAAYLLYARGVFEPKQTVVLMSDDAEGVTIGMDMTFAGFPIGRVARTELAQDGQVRIIVDAFAPSTAEVDLAIEILLAARAAGWAPIRHRDALHDRASYRYFWQVLQRAHQTSYAGGAQLPAEVRQAFFQGAVD